MLNFFLYNRTKKLLKYYWIISGYGKTKEHTKEHLIKQFHNIEICLKNHVRPLVG